MSSQELEGKVAIVTGAAGGIGSETARVLVAAGARVVLADLPGAPLAEAAGTVVEPNRAAYHEVDISDEVSVQSLMRFTAETFGRLDGLANVAALTSMPDDTNLISMTVEAWDRAFAVNARGTMLMCKHALPLMIEGGGGSIVNISSGNSFGGEFAPTAYACSKGAINTLTSWVATQYGAQLVRCNAVAPGLVHTPKLDEHLPKPLVEIIVDSKLIPRIGEPSDIAEWVCFLISDRSAWTTGQVFRVDGGHGAHQPHLAGFKKFIAESAAGAA